MRKALKNIVLFSILGTSPLFAENLHFDCKPRNPRETPYRTFNVTVYDADTDEAQSEISYASFPDDEASTPDHAGLVDGFARSDVYSTQVSSRYRMIRIEGGRMGASWRRDVLQLQRRQGTQYRGLFEFPEGSDQLDLCWNSTLVLLCERTL